MGHRDCRLNGARRTPRQTAEWRVSDVGQVPRRRRWGAARRGSGSPGKGCEWKWEEGCASGRKHGRSEGLEATDSLSIPGLQAHEGPER